MGYVYGVAGCTCNAAVKGFDSPVVHQNPTIAQKTEPLLVRFGGRLGVEISLVGPICSRLTSVVDHPLG